MWLTGRLAPDFKTIADFRRDNGTGIRNVCRRFVLLCRDLKLFSQAIVAIDSSKFKAVNSRDRNFTPGKIDKRKEPDRGEHPTLSRRLGHRGPYPAGGGRSEERTATRKDCHVARPDAAYGADQRRIEAATRRATIPDRPRFPLHDLSGERHWCGWIQRSGSGRRQAPSDCCARSDQRRPRSDATQPDGERRTRHHGQTATAGDR